MNYLRIACIAGLCLITEFVQASEEDVFLEKIQPPSEQMLGQGQSALWTLPDVATEYQPLQSTPALHAALQAQHEGRFLDALIQLDEGSKSGAANDDAKSEINLLHASFLLQGNQSKQAIEMLAFELAQTRHAADAYALTAMAYLQQGQMQQALDAANHAKSSVAQSPGDGLLPSLALSYALQGTGRLADAREVMRDFNSHVPQQVIALAREAELALTMGQIQSARTLMDQAHMDATRSYVIAVSGLTYLISGQASAAKAAFETVLHLNPKDAKALLGLGLAEIKLGNLDAGLKKLQAANEAYPGNALILTYLGRVQQQLGQTEAAKASWRNAQLADPKDPTPWLYQAQAALQANRPLEARDSLREAQARTAYRSVYRGESLLQEDEQLLQANLAEVQRSLGMDKIAFQTLSATTSEKNSANLKNQADVLQGQRFGESARRSLLLQSLFNDKPGNLPSRLDVYGDGAGQTGATTPQHGAVSLLNAQHASYNNYDSLFTRRTLLEADATIGSNHIRQEQIRMGAGSDTLGLSLAGLQFQTDGSAPYTNLDNRVGQGLVQWLPTTSTQAFVSYQTFHTQHGEIRYPADPLNWGEYKQIEDDSSLTRLGLRHSLADNSELRGLISLQKTRQTDNWEWIANTLPYSTMPCCGPTLPFPQFTFHASSQAHSVELQYHRSGTGYATQWGMSSVRSPLDVSSFGTSAVTNIAQQIYVNWQQALNPWWQLEAGLAWGRNNKEWGASSTSLRRWLPKLGMVYTPDSATHVRLAAWKGLDDAAVGNASLAPTTLAGVVLIRPNDIYKQVQGIALGADRQLDTSWLLEGQTQRRRTDEPFYYLVQQFTSIQVGESRLALHWQPGNHPVSVTLAYEDEHIWNQPEWLTQDSVREQHLRSQQLGLRWLASSQWTANLALSHNLITATQHSSDTNFNPILLDIQDHFNQADASLNWQFNRVGAMDFGVRNAGDRRIQYTEIDPLIPRFNKGRLWYMGLKLAW